MSDLGDDWIKGRLACVLSETRCYFVPASGVWMADVRGDLGLTLWALGRTAEDARAELQKVARAYFTRQLEGLALPA